MACGYGLGGSYPEGLRGVGKQQADREAPLELCHDPTEQLQQARALVRVGACGNEQQGPCVLEGPRHSVNQVDATGDLIGVCVAQEDDRLTQVTAQLPDSLRALLDAFEKRVHRLLGSLEDHRRGGQPEFRKRSPQRRS